MVLFVWVNDFITFVRRGFGPGRLIEFCPSPPLADISGDHAPRPTRMHINSNAIKPHTPINSTDSFSSFLIRVFQLGIRCARIANGTISESLVRVNLVVVGDPSWQLTHDGFGIWSRTDTDIVALDRANEGFSHSVALWTFERRRPRFEPDVAGEAAGVAGDVAAAVIRKPFDRDGQRLTWPNRYSMAATIRSRTSSPAMPPVVARNSWLPDHSSRAQTQPAP